MIKTNKILQSLETQVIVSCQPVIDGPMDSVEIVTALALAAENGGAAALRIAGVESVRSVAKSTSLPIIGITKRPLPNSKAQITLYLEDVEALVDAGATIIAYDATSHPRPVPTNQIVQRIHSCNVLAMADCGNIEDGKRALTEGADILGTTLSGYAYDLLPETATPDFKLVKDLSALDGAFVIAEGRCKTPDDAALAGC